MGKPVTSTLLLTSLTRDSCDFGGSVREVRRFISSRPRRVRAVAAGSVVLAVLLLLARWNAASLAFLRDHPNLPTIGWAVVCILLATAALVLVPPLHRRRASPLVAFGTVLAFAVGGVALGLASFPAGRGDGLDPSGELVDRKLSADGRYEVRVSRWVDVLGEDGWDVVIQRHDGHRLVAVRAGCLSQSEAEYAAIQSVEAGRAGIATDLGVLDIRFVPGTMRVTDGIPAALCRGHD